MNMELFKEIAAKCNGSLIDGCLIEIETLRQQLAEKSAEAMRFETMFCSVNDDLSKLETQLAAAQAQIVGYREALLEYRTFFSSILAGREALDLPTDTSALEATIAKAGEVMRERCAEYVMRNLYSNSDDIDAIRALPGVTLGDLTK